MSASIDSWSAFRGIWMLWSLCGINPPPVGTPWRGRYIFLGCIGNFFIAFVFPFTVIIETILSENLESFCTNLYIAIPDICCIVEYVYVICIRRRLMKLKPLLAHLDRRLCSEEECAAVLKGIHLGKRVFVTFAQLIVCVMMSSAPLGFLAKEKRLMFPGWFPWNYRSSNYAFVSTYCLQSSMFFIHALLELGNDTYTPVSMIVVAGHIKALGVRIQNIGASTLLNLDALSPEEQDAAYSQLIECIRDHEVILELQKIIGGITSTAAFIQFFSTALSDCTLGVSILHSDWTVSNMLNWSILFFTMSLETFIFCYAAEVVCYESEQLVDCIYSCNWYMQHLKFRRALLMLIRRSQKLNVIKAAGFIHVRIPTFIAVMKGSYSMFTVLSTNKS